LPAHEVLRETEPTPEMVEAFSFQQRQREEDDRERERRTYRGRAVAMLQRYMRYSIETGRLPSLLGREFFRATVTAYTVVTFEDRVIFVHDMEKCLEKLDEFSRQLIARHILQEHDQAATGKLLHCTERTVRTYIPLVLDLLVEILLDVGLMGRLDSDRKNSCQGGKTLESLQVIARMGNIKFEIFPVYPLQFAMLEIESKKKRKSSREGRVSGARLLLL
jgi:hypothetical protein